MGAFMNMKNKFHMMLVVFLSVWFLGCIAAPKVWCRSKADADWNSVLAKAKEEKDFNTPKDFPMPKPHQNVQPQEAEQQPPVITPPIIDPAMIIPSPITDPEMVVTPGQTEPTEEESTLEEGIQEMTP